MYKSFSDYRALKAKGLRREANEKALETIKEYRNNPDISFVRAIIDDSGSEKIHFELFRQIVFPFFKEKYFAFDTDAILIMAKNIENIYQDKEICAELNEVSKIDLLKLLLSKDQNNEWAKREFIESQIQWLEHCIHEWPSGILYESDGASLDECKEIKQTIEELRNLDQLGEHSILLDEVESKLIEYMSRLDNKSFFASCCATAKT